MIRDSYAHFATYNAIRNFGFIPKALRDALHLEAGDSFELVSEGNKWRNQLQFKRMKSFLDTSVLIATFYGEHEHHDASFALCINLTEKSGCTAAHCLAEVYSVRTSQRS